METASRLTIGPAESPSDGSCTCRQCHPDYYKDTSADERHERAETIIQEMDAGDLPTGCVTNCMLLKTLNWIHERQRHDIAVDLRERLVSSAGFVIAQSAQKDYHRAVELFEIYDGLSFGDATIAAYIEREGIEYLYSFDDDFDGLEWVTRLPTASDPFG